MDSSVDWIQLVIAALACCVPQLPFSPQVHACRLLCIVSYCRSMADLACQEAKHPMRWVSLQDHRPRFHDLGDRRHSFWLEIRTTGTRHRVISPHHIWMLCPAHPVERRLR